MAKFGQVLRLLQNSKHCCTLKPLQPTVDQTARQLSAHHAQRSVPLLSPNLKLGNLLPGEKCQISYESKEISKITATPKRVYDIAGRYTKETSYEALVQKEQNKSKSSTMKSFTALPLRRKLVSVAPRYAKTLYIQASKTNQLQKVHCDLLKIQSRLTTDTTFRSSVLASRNKNTFTEKDVDDLSMGLNLSWMTVDFLKKLNKHKKIYLLNQIISAFSVLVVKSREDLVCEVTTSSPLDQETLRCLKEKVKASLQTKREIKVRNVLDSSIGSGVMVKLDDDMLDMSVAKNLQKFEMLLKKGAYI